ncbi:MAG: HAD-IC family P-type ATPase [Verrucomicrobia bacterium]|nr:HAD-IC family P-type ATPase [Verrucomicrobiota bacterium]
MAVLLIACPCALGLATPIALWHGTHVLSSKGLLCRNGLLLDALADCTVVLFDKTGTLSDDQLYIDRVEWIAGVTVDKDWLYQAIAGVERGWAHPVARALRTLSPHPLPDSDRKILPGLGVSAKVDGRTVIIQQLDSQDGKKCLSVSVDGMQTAHIFLRENLRAEVARLMEQLKARGLRSRILTGDPNPVWREISGVAVEHKLSALDKVRIVEDERGNGETVLFVGDGLNDAAAMAAAQGSIAMGNALALTQSTAQAVLVSDRLESLVRAIDLARDMRRRLRGNLIFAPVTTLLELVWLQAGCSILWWLL